MTTTTQVLQQTQAPRKLRYRLSGATLLAVGAATVANLGLYFVAGLFFPAVTAWAGAGPAQIAGANGVYLLIGALAFAAVARYSSQPARHYLTVATIGLLLSLILPISAGLGYGAPGAPAAGAATVITLSLMHIVSYAISVPLFLRLLQD